MKKVFLSVFLIGAVCLMGSCSGDSGKQGDSAVKSAGEVIDYGIGATQVKAKKKAEQKLQDINQQKNKELEDALAE